MRLGFDLIKSEVYRDDKKDVYIHNKNNYLQINNTFFAVFDKKQVDPNDLITDFSNAISSANEAFLTFLSLEMRNKLMSKSALIGKKLSKINESAFIHHKDTLNPEHAFDQFLI
ncbi:MAG: response regulator receiver domain, partial [Bacteroidales bacterium]